MPTSTLRTMFMIQPARVIGSAGKGSSALSLVQPKYCLRPAPYVLAVPLTMPSSTAVTTETAPWWSASARGWELIQAGRTEAASGVRSPGADGERRSPGVASSLAVGRVADALWTLTVRRPGGASPALLGA